jgi:hypothetical protein
VNDDKPGELTDERHDEILRLLPIISTRPGIVQRGMVIIFERLPPSSLTTGSSATMSPRSWLPAMPLGPDGDWTAVAAEVRARMTAPKMSTAELARRTALSPTTIRGIRKGNGHRA